MLEVLVASERGICQRVPGTAWNPALGHRILPFTASTIPRDRRLVHSAPASDQKQFIQDEGLKLHHFLIRA